MNPASVNTNSTGGLRAVCALYMRVSTKGHGQTTDTQALALRDYANNRQFQVIQEYRDEGFSGSKDRRAFVFEMTTGRLVKELEQNNQVLGVAFSADSKYLFTCGDNAVYQWEIATGKKVKTFEGTGSYAINSIAVTPDGRRLLAGGEDKVLRLWDLTTAKEIWSSAAKGGGDASKGITSTITAVAITPDGRRGISGQVDGVIRYWGLPAR